MKYYVCFSKDGESADNFTPHEDLLHAIKAAHNIILNDDSRSEDYYIQGIDKSVNPPYMVEFDVWGYELCDEPNMDQYFNIEDLKVWLYAVAHNNEDYYDCIIDIIKRLPGFMEYVKDKKRGIYE